MTGAPEENQIESVSIPDDVVPFANFSAPEPLETAPPAFARWVAFAGILISGLMGGLIGFGTSDLLGFPRWASSLVAIGFAIGCAIGVGIVAQLTLRAMNEWNAVHHPEDRR